MKSKGFTLIELLAVIVILAIIALIATPIILNIIDNTKEQSVKRSIDHYMSAATAAIARANLNNTSGGVNPRDCIIGDDGNLTCDGTPIPVEVDGDKPKTGGTITFENGKITQINLTMPDGNTYELNEKGNVVKSGEGSGGSAGTVPDEGDGEGTEEGTYIYRNSNELLFVGDSLEPNKRWCLVSDGLNKCFFNGSTKDLSKAFESKEDCEKYIQEEELDDAECINYALSYETDLSNIKTDAYLKHEVTNNEVTASYVCLKKEKIGTSKDVCLQGYDTKYYDQNKNVINDNFGKMSGVSCKESTTNYYCETASLEIRAANQGATTVDDSEIRCRILSTGSSYCKDTEL